MIVALTQMACGKYPEENLRRQLMLLEQAGEQGAQVMCTQELFRTRYFCQSEDHNNFALAEPIPGPTTHAIGEIARKYQAVIIAAVFERRAPGLYHNSAVLIEADGSVAGIYRKMHIPDDPLYYEKFYFTPGDRGFVAWKSSRGTIGALICWDQWYPEAARLTALAGAQVIFYPTAIGWQAAEKEAFGQSQLESWEIMHRSHAIANGCYVCAPNRIGFEPSASPSTDGGIEFWGHSLIVAPDGRVLERGSTDAEEVILADLDLSRVEFSRTHWPFLRDRRIDAYGDLTRRYRD